MRRILAIFWVFALVQPWTSASSQSAERPTGTVSFIVPFPAGGPSDVAARRLVADLARELGQPVVIQNIAGATGAVGTHKLAQSEPNGMTIMFGSPNELILAPATNTAVPYKPSELVNVGLSGITPLVLVSHPDAPFRSPDELVDFLRADPKRELSYGSVGVGSLQHLATADLATTWKLRMLHVPYKGAAPMLNDLLGQQIHVSAMTLSGGTLDLIRAGKLRSLGVLLPERTSLAPDLPTINESRSFKNVDYSLWGGIFVPARTPMPIQERLNGAINRVIAQPAMRERIQAGGSQPAPAMSLIDLSARYMKEIARYEGIAKALDIRSE